MKIGDFFSKQFNVFLPAYQLSYDYFKHITTLSLGAILFFSAFIIKTVEAKDKVELSQQISILLSVVAFLLSILFSLTIMKYISKSVNTFATVGDWTHLFDQSTELSDEKRRDEELQKVGKLIQDKLARLDKDIKIAQKWIKPAWFAFLFGVIFAILYIAAPIVSAILRRL